MKLDSDRTNYRIEVRWSPVHECLVSIEAYLGKSNRSTMDLGAAWAREVRQRISSDLAERLAHPRDLDLGMLQALALQSDAPGEVDAFAHWAAALPRGELFERLAPLDAEDVCSLSGDLGGFRDEVVRVMRQWNDQYFQHIDPAILTGLASEADRVRERLPVETPVDLVERVTSGVRFVPTYPVDLVILTPQYHYRPWNVYGRFGSVQLFRYPADVLPAEPGEPSVALLRLTHALGDQSRLRILRHLARGPRSFTDIARFIGLSKSTVHHHLVVLRAAGLVGLEQRDEKSRIYSLRAGLVDTVADRLQDYLGEE